ncbi:MAG: hypothetical protein ACRYGF_03650 [Janthinobacterium lividum]
MGDISDGIRHSLGVSNAGFQEASARERSLLDASRKAQNLAVQSLNQIVGAGAYPYIVPQVIGNGEGPFPMVIWNGGSNALTNVTVTIYGDQPSEGLSEESFGAVSHEWPRYLKRHVVPHLTGGKETYVVVVTMQTPLRLYTEVLTFFRHSEGTSWGDYWWVYQNKDGTFVANGQRRSGKISIPLCRSHIPSDAPMNPEDRRRTSKVRLC